MSRPQERDFELVLESMIPLHRAFGTLMRSVMKYLYTTSFEGEEINERWGQLNWEDHRQGRETLTRKNLINLAQNLWTYLLLNNSTRMRTFSSMYRDGGWTQFSTRHATTFEQRVQMLLQFLKVFTAKWKPQASQFTRSIDINLEEFGILNEYSESL